jgi:hypothetical protein
MTVQRQGKRVVVVNKPLHSQSCAIVIACVKAMLSRENDSAQRFDLADRGVRDAAQLSSCSAAKQSRPTAPKM